MELSVATWNIRRKKSSEVWNKLSPEPDVFLLQETSVSEAESTSKKVFGQIIGNKRNWGSAIASQKYELEPIKLTSNSHPGALVTANLRIGKKLEVQLISMYGLMLEKYSITTLHRMLSDLTPLIDNYASKNIILAGDFNASLQWDTKQTNQSHKILFDRIQDFGLVDCLAPSETTPSHTWRNPQNGSLWQLDYLYASKTLFNKLKSCTIIDTSTFTFSDHNAIMATFDL